MIGLEILDQAINLNELKDIVREAVGPFFYVLFQKLYWITLASVLPRREGEMYWVWLLSGLAIGLGAYVWQHSKSRDLSFSKLLRYCLPQKIFAHKSAIVDYQYYFPSRIIHSAFVVGTLGVSSVMLAEYCKSLLQHIFGPVESQLEAGLSARFVYSVLLVLAADVGFFIAHYLEHKVPFFWEFHKVHHSAEVLTPITNSRLHPMDDFLQNFFMNLCIGVAGGIFGYFFYNGLDRITVLNVSGIMLVYLVTANLRHSHMWVSYGRALSHVFYSPAMHHIHHSIAERHRDKNFGRVFSFCDYLAGTLYVPKEQEDLKYGLMNQEHAEYSSAWRLLVLPVTKAARLMSRSLLGKPSLQR